MPLKDLDRASVLCAIEEHDALGRDSFLTKYGFGKAHSYVLRHDGKQYDSKAIAGAAHGYLGSDADPLMAKSFTGGEKTVQATLAGLGFTVEITKTRNPNWTRDELILALEYYLDHPGEGHDDERPGVIKLSEDINAVGRFLGHVGTDTFRNPNGVSMKLLNFRAHDPAYLQRGRVGLARGNKLEKVLWDEFVSDRGRLKRVADRIRSWAKHLDTSPDDELPSEDEPDVSAAPEGRILTRMHRYRERDRKLVKRKKASFMKKHGRLFCEVCDFDFVQVYGERGDGFIECHHTLPVSEMAPNTKTKLSDLALLCANCHRMVHVKSPWLSVAELVSIRKRQSS